MVTGFGSLRWPSETSLARKNFDGLSAFCVSPVDLFDRGLKFWASLAWKNNGVLDFFGNLSVNIWSERVCVVPNAKVVERSSELVHE